MRYGGQGLARRGISPGIHGVSDGRAAVAAAPVKIDLPDAIIAPPLATAASDANNAAGEAEKPWPIPRKRFEFSCLFVGMFGCILLIAPVYLIFSRFGTQLMGAASTAPVFHSGMGQTLRFLELILGLLGMPAILFLPRSLRADFMWMLGVFMLCIVMLLAKGQGDIFAILVGYPTVALLSLVALDAITGIRPAVTQSLTFRNWQFFISAGVTILWFLPAGLAVCGKQITAIVPHGGQLWVHLTIMAAVFGAEFAGLLGMLAYFSEFKRWVNTAGRLLGTLGLTVTMGVGLWTALQPGVLARQTDLPVRIEMLWLFMIVSGSLLLVWAGLTQRFILSAARIRTAESGTEN